MSDKNRNMNDINDQQTIDRTDQVALYQTAEQQAFSEEIRRRLAEPGSGKPTLDEFKVMVYKDREKRRKKRNAMVACVVAAFVVGLFSFEHFVPEVGADKNPKETIVTEDGVIIEDGGYGSSEEADNIWVTEDWEQIEDAQKHYPNVWIPHYYPKGYTFNSLKIKTIIEEDYIMEYIFRNEKDNVLEIEIINVENGTSALDINDVEECISCEKGEIYIQGRDENKRATIFTDDGNAICLWGDISNKEIMKIIESLTL